MLFDNKSTTDCFRNDEKNDNSLFMKSDEKSMEKDNNTEDKNSSPPSLPELNIAAEISSPNSGDADLQSTGSPTLQSEPPLNSPNQPVTDDDGNKKILKCDYCDKTFTLANVLKVHQRIHTGEKPYVCEICGKAFNQSGSLNRHRNTHRYRDSSDTTYVCRYCNAKFLHGSLLENHEKTAHQHHRKVGRPKNSTSLNIETNLNNNNNSNNTNNSENFNDSQNINIPINGDSNSDKSSRPGSVGDKSYSEDITALQNDSNNVHILNSTLENSNNNSINENDNINDDNNNKNNTNGNNSNKKEFNFTCPYCQIEIPDVKEFGLHLAQHNIPINSTSSPVTSSPNPPLTSISNSNAPTMTNVSSANFKDIPNPNSLLSQEALLQHLTALSNKLKLPPPLLPPPGMVPTPQNNHNSINDFVHQTMHAQTPFDRLRNLNNTNTNNNTTNELGGNYLPPHGPPPPTTGPLFNDSYNLAAFVLASLSKDYLYKMRGDNNNNNTNNTPNLMNLPNNEFIKNHLSFSSHLKNPMLNNSNIDFHSLFSNLPKQPIHNFFGNPELNLNGNKLDPNNLLNRSDNTNLNKKNEFNGLTNNKCNVDKTVNNILNNSPNKSSTQTLNNSTNNCHSSLNLSNGSDQMVGVNKQVNSMHRGSPNSTGQTNNLNNGNSVVSSAKSVSSDIFYSRKNPGERRRCPDCDKQFTCESALRIHYRKHSGERPYACEFCSKTFSQNGTLKRHHLTCKSRPNLLGAPKMKLSTSSTKSSLRNQAPPPPDSSYHHLHHHHHHHNNLHESSNPNNNSNNLDHHHPHHHHHSIPPPPPPPSLGLGNNSSPPMPPFCSVPTSNPHHPLNYILSSNKLNDTLAASFEQHFSPHRSSSSSVFSSPQSRGGCATSTNIFNTPTPLPPPPPPPPSSSNNIDDIQKSTVSNSTSDLINIFQTRLTSNSQCDEPTDLTINNTNQKEIVSTRIRNNLSASSSLKDTSSIINQESRNKDIEDGIDGDYYGDDDDDDDNLKPLQLNVTDDCSSQASNQSSIKRTHQQIESDYSLPRKRVKKSIPTKNDDGNDIVNSTFLPFNIKEERENDEEDGDDDDDDDQTIHIDFCDNNNNSSSDNKINSNIKIKDHKSIYSNMSSSSESGDSSKIDQILHQYSPLQLLDNLVNRGQLHTCNHCQIYFLHTNSFHNHCSQHVNNKNNNNNGDFFNCALCDFQTHNFDKFIQHFNTKLNTNVSTTASIITS